MPLITLRLRAGLTPRRWVGISGSIAAHCSSFSQYSFAIHLTPAKLGSLNRNQPSRGKSYWFNWVLSLVQRRWPDLYTGPDLAAKETAG